MFSTYLSGDFLRGGFVTAQVDIPEGMDKASGWSLYVAREALKDAGLSNRADVLARCGVILGNLSFPTLESHQRIAPIYDAALSDAIGELLAPLRALEDEPLGPAARGLLYQLERGLGTVDERAASTQLAAERLAKICRIPCVGPLDKRAASVFSACSILGSRLANQSPTRLNTNGTPTKLQRQPKRSASTPISGKPIT